jgi:hypothetical protein
VILAAEESGSQGTGGAESSRSASERLPLALLTGWVLLALFAQVLFLAQWPLFVLDHAIEPPGSQVLAVLRLGAYAGLAWGLLNRGAAAWAMLVLELWRSFGLFVALLILREANIGVVYPCPWAQGLLAGALPLMLPINVVLGRADPGGPGGAIGALAAAPAAPVRPGGVAGAK